MATLKCPRCRANVSEKAVACNCCAYPAKSFLEIHKATFKFLEINREVVERDCYIYDKSYRKLAECKIGSEASFICCQPTEVLIEMAGCLCKQSVEAMAGKKYEVRLIRFGLISVKNF